VWSALSRAVGGRRRLDGSCLSQRSPPFFPDLPGGPDFRSEILEVRELGYRRSRTGSLVLRHAVSQRRRSLRSLEPGPAGALVIGKRNGGRARIEAWGACKPQKVGLSAGLWADTRVASQPAGHTSGVARGKEMTEAS